MKKRKSHNSVQFCVNLITLQRKQYTLEAGMFKLITNLCPIETKNNSGNKALKFFKLYRINIIS